MRTRFNQNYIDFSGGVQAFTSPLLLAPNETPFCYNTQVRRPGVLSKALGYAQLGSGSGTPACRGVFAWGRENGDKELYRVFNTNLEYYSGTASGWTTVGSGLGATGSSPVEWAIHFVNTGTGVGSGADSFQERMYVSQGLQGTIKFTTGTSISGVADVYARHLATYKGVLYAGNVKQGSNEHPTRVIYSDVAGDNFPSDYLIDDMGEPIKALREFGGALFIFTENKLGYYDGYKLSIISVDGGTTNAETVQVIEGKLMWYNRRGVYMFGGGSESILISRPVNNFLEAITDAEAVTGGIDPLGRYLLSIGDVTVGGVAYQDVVVRYDALINAWDILTNRPYKYFTRNKAGGVYELYATNPDGKQVWQGDLGYSINGVTQASIYQTPKLYGDPSTVDDYKTAYRIEVVYKPTNAAEYITVKYRLDGTGTWAQIGGTNNNINLTGTDEIKVSEIILPAKATGKFLELQFSHSSITGGFEIYSINLKYDITQYNE